MSTLTGGAEATVAGVGGVDFTAEAKGLIGAEAVVREEEWPSLAGAAGGSTVVDSGFLAGAGLVVIGAGVGTEATTTGDSSVLTFSVDEDCATAAGVGAAGFANSCWT
ncbi:TPA: hypothetical protein ACGJ06_006454, partial [Pseudomonas aeruginosa]